MPDQPRSSASRSAMSSSSAGGQCAMGSPFRPEYTSTMDAVDFFLTRYSEVHSGLVDGLFGSLSDTQLRARPHPGVNTIAWLLWHSARIEDVALNRFLTDRSQVLDEWI